MLGPKIEGLLDDHLWKPKFLFQLSQLLGSVGNFVECRQVLTDTLRLDRELGNVNGVVHTLWCLPDIHLRMDRHKEGMEQAKEVLEIFQRLGNTLGQAQCLMELGLLLYSDEQFDVAEEIASRAISLVPEEGNQFLACQSHDVLGNTHRSKGETKKAIRHFEEALRIASFFGWHNSLFQIYFSLGLLFLHERRLDDGHAHAEHAMSYAGSNAYNLGSVIALRAVLWYKQHKHEEARSQLLRAVDTF